MGVLIFQELAPFLAFSGWLSRRQRACPSVFLDKQFFKEQRKYSGDSCIYNCIYFTGKNNLVSFSASAVGLLTYTSNIGPVKE